VQPVIEILPEFGEGQEPAPYIRARWKLLRPMTPIEIHIDPCPMRLAGVAAASASFSPPENSGIESLLLLSLRQLQVKRAKRAFIIAFGSSYRGLMAATK
jgi:hypothetical protein